MLAPMKTLADALGMPAPEPPPQLEYDGFPFWEAFATEPNRERKTADLLDEKLSVVVYWPHYTVQRCTRRRRHIAREMSVIPGILLAPIGILGSRRDDILAWARLRPVAYGRPLTKAEVEIIREITANLNRRQALRQAGLRVGGRAGFRNPLYSAFFGEGTVIKIAKGGRISLKMERKLFGGRDVVTVMADELEPM